jgi:hypothetical protein
MISQQLLDILVCPLGKSELRLEDGCLVCIRCGPKFRIMREGYPNMLIEEAELPPGCSGINDLPCEREKALQQAESKSAR